MNNSQQVSRVSHITKPYLITTVAAFLTLFISTSVQGSYTYTTLDVPGASSTHAYGIDGDNIVGRYSDGSGTHGFMYDGTDYTPLDYPDANETYAYGIDGDNIVGGYNSSGTVRHGFHYDGTTYTQLDVPGSIRTFASDIDGSHIVGLFWSGDDYLWYGFDYDGTTYTPLEVPGASATYARGIDGGNIVGRYLDGSGTRSFMYDGTDYTLLDVPGASSTSAYGIDGGNIVGYYSVVVGYNYNEMFGEMHPVYEEHGFIYDGTTYTTLDVPGASATYARGIDGNNIVGYYIDGSGNSHGFLTTIPEPSTALLLCLGLMALATGRRNR